MSMKVIAIALGVFLVVIAGWFAVMIYMAESDVSQTENQQAAPEAGQNHKAQLEQEVLQGYEVVHRMGGIPTVRYYDPGAMDYGEQRIDSALFAQANYGADIADMGGDVGYDHGTACYKLALVYEHGLFGLPQDPGEAVRYYRMAHMSGHPEGEKNATRLEAAGH